MSPTNRGQGFQFVRTAREVIKERGTCNQEEDAVQEGPGPKPRSRARLSIKDTKSLRLAETLRTCRGDGITPGGGEVWKGGNEVTKPNGVAQFETRPSRGAGNYVVYGIWGRTRHRDGLELHARKSKTQRKCYSRGDSWWYRKIKGAVGTNKENARKGDRGEAGNQRAARNPKGIGKSKREDSNFFKMKNLREGFRGGKG